LKELGMEDNTLVILTSDNGGHPNHAFNQPLRGSKWNLYEGGIRVPMIIRWPGTTAENSTCRAPVIQTDLMATLRNIVDDDDQYQNWDGTSILPLLKGGQPTLNDERPLIWHFPYYHPEGEKFSDALDSIGRNDGRVSKTFPQSAIRVGDEKLIYFYENSDFEYFHLDQDVAEQNDLKKKFPKRAASLKEELLNELAKRNSRFPIEQKLPK